MKNTINDLAATGAVSWGSIAEKIDENFKELEDSIPKGGGLDETQLGEYLERNEYAKKTDIPTIPTKVSEFENDNNYATTSYVQEAVSNNKLDNNFLDMLVYCLRNATYTVDVSSIINEIEKLKNNGDGEDDDNTEKILVGIKTDYSGTPVIVGTSINELVGITVTAQYMDGTTEIVNDYTITGTIVQGVNVLTINYKGKTSTIEVIGLSILVESIGKGAVISFENAYGMAISKRTDRAFLIPIGQYLAVGSKYTFTMGSKRNSYSYGIQIMKVPKSGITFDYDVESAEQKTYFNEVSSRTVDTGWLNEDYIYECTTNNEILCVNFKLASTGNFNDAHCEDIKNNFKIEVINE